MVEEFWNSVAICLSWLASVELPCAAAALAWFWNCVASWEVICLNSVGFCCCTCWSMLKKEAAGEILGESVGVVVLLVLNGLGDVRLMALPGCKVTGSKLVNALIVMAFRMHVRYRIE